MAEEAGQAGRQSQSRYLVWKQRTVDDGVGLPLPSCSP